MTLAICPRCCPHLAHLREIATSGAKQIMAFAKEMQTETDTLPDDVKPYGEILTKISIQTLTETYWESLKLISELSLQEITRAALPPNHHSEPDSLQRSGSNEI